MQIETRGWKSTDQSINLGSLNIVVGPNGVGKSSIADALRYVALGFIPAQGRRPADTAVMMRGDTATVRLVLDDGRWCSRTIKRKGKGLTESAECSWLGENASNDQHDVAILQLFGGEREDIAVLLDIKGLINAAATDRTKRMQRILDTATPAADIFGSITRLTMIRLAGVDEAKVPTTRDEDGSGEWIPICRPLIPGYQDATDQYGVLRWAAKELQGKIADTGLQGAEAWVNRSKNDAAAKARTAKAAKGELEARIQQLPAVNSERIEILESTRANLDQQLGADRKRQQEAAAKASQVAASKKRLESAQAAHDRALAASSQFLDNAPDTEGINMRLQAAEAELAALVAPAAPDYAEADALDAGAVESEAQARAVVIPDLLTTAEAKAAVARLADDLANAQESPWSKVDSKASRIEALSVGNGERVTELRSIAGELKQLAVDGGGDVDGLIGALAVAQEDLVTAEAQAEESRKARAAATEQRDKLQATADSARSVAKGIRAELSAQHKDAVAAHGAARAKLTATVQTLQRELGDATRRNQQLATDLSSAARELDLAQQHATDVGEEAELVDLSATETQLAEIAAELKTLRASEATHGELGRLVADLASREAEQKVFSALEWACARARNDAVTAAGGPLLTAVNKVLTGAGWSEHAYLEASDLGLVRDGKRIPVQALSGSEWTIFCAALLAGMQSFSNAEIKPVIVEGSECSEKSLRSLLSGLAASDGLTLGLVMTWVEGVTAPGWAVVDLGDQRQAQAA